MIRYSTLVALCLFVVVFASAQTATFTATQVCLGKQTTLAGSCAYNDTAVASWNWDLDSDGVYADGTGKVLNNIFPQADTFYVGLKVILNSGVADSTLVAKEVIINPLPNVNFHVDNLCAGKAALYADQSTIASGTITQYLWDFNNDNIVDDNSGPNVSYTCGPASVYVTKLECVSDQGCKAFAVKTTQVFPQPVASFTVSDNCFGDQTAFTNTTLIPGDVLSYSLWTFGDGQQETNSGVPKHLYTSPATYNAALMVVSSNNCKDTATMSITIHEKPALSFQYSGDTIMRAGESVTITAVGTFVSYNWSNGSTASSITVSDGGLFNVEATDVNGCKNSLSTEIKVIVAGEVSTQNNILTPNGDGINDNLLIDNFEAYQHCDLKVYNVWNDVVYKNADYKNEWNGTNGSKSLDPGTYYYVIKCDDKQSMKGTINIIR